MKQNYYVYDHAKLGAKAELLMLNLFFAYICFYATNKKDATDASVEWGFAKEVKLTRQEPFVHEIARSPARSRYRTQRVLPTTSFSITLSGAIHHSMYTTGLSKDIPCHATAAVPIAWYTIIHLMILVTRPVAT